MKTSCQGYCRTYSTVFKSNQSCALFDLVIIAGASLLCCISCCHLVNMSTHQASNSCSMPAAAAPHLAMVAAFLLDDTVGVHCDMLVRVARYCH